MVISAMCVIIINASWNTISRASPVMHHVFGYHLCLLGTALPLAATVATVQLNLREVIPIGGMLANNGLIAINLAYQNLEKHLFKMFLILNPNLR